MRIGENPQKLNKNKITQKYHRVIMVFYIPDICKNEKESYYNNLGDILDISLNSLINTINFETTNITLVNNASSKTINRVVEKHAKNIDKYVVYKENKGKVNAVINEARGVYEKFVTITDADILFYPGWEKASMELFRDFNNVGAVSPYPFPYAPFYVNKSSFGYNTIFCKVKYGKYIEDKDIDLYVKGTSLPNIVNRPASSIDWKKKHFVLKNGNKIAIIGSFHVVGTYQSYLFRNEYSFPSIIFKNQYEEKFIDCLADKKGCVKLSTLKSYIYHIGNSIDDVVKDYQEEQRPLDKIEKSFFEDFMNKKENSKISIFFNRILGHFLIKYKWKKIR